MSKFGQDPIPGMPHASDSPELAASPAPQSAPEPTHPVPTAPAAPLYDDGPVHAASAPVSGSPFGTLPVTGLRILNGPWSNITLDLPRTGEEILIGRNDPPAVTVDIDLSEAEISQPPLISRRHAIIFRDRGTGAVVIQDVGSTNGTWVDGVRLRPGDTVTPVSADSVVRFANIKLIAVSGKEIE